VVYMPYRANVDMRLRPVKFGLAHKNLLLNKG